MVFSSYIPTKVLFGCGALDSLFAEKLPGKKALIVTTSGGSCKRNGSLRRVQNGLEQAGVSYIVYDKVVANPEKQHVEEAAGIVVQNGLEFIIGLGGGSAIDSAKAIALLSKNPGDLWDYYRGGSGKGQALRNEPLPVIAISTTSGTGTEADPWMVITKTETNEKIGFGNSSTYPTISVCDPTLSTTVPPFLTASQGFDVLFHCAEGYVSRSANALSDLYALHAIDLVGKNLVKAVRDGNDIDARTDLAFANLLAGFVQSISSCSGEHAIAHAISGIYPNVPHGIALVMITEAYFTELAQSGVADDRLIAMAKVLGVSNASSPFDFAAALSRLIVETGLSDSTMSSYGITQDALPAIAVNARETMGGLLAADSMDFTDELSLQILKKSYR